MSKFKKLAILFALSVLAGAAWGQTTAVTATITDSDSFVWSNCAVTFQFVPNAQFPNLNSYSISGVPITSATYSQYLGGAGTCNGSGAITFTTLDNTRVLPQGSTYKITVKSNTSAPATAYNPIQISGASESLTSYLSSNAITPRFPATFGAYGYGDVELTTVPLPGGFYFNTTTFVTRQWNGTVWGNLSGSTGVSQINGSTGAFSFTGTVSCTGLNPVTCNFTGGSGSYTLNTAEMGAYASGALTHTNHYVVPLAQTTSQINTLLAAAPTGTYEFQGNDTVANSFTNTNWQANITHNGLYWYTFSKNIDSLGVVCDARQVYGTFSSSSKVVTISGNAISTYDIGKIMWAWNSTTNTAYESQITSSSDSLHFTVTTNAPYTQSSLAPLWIGTDNTTNMNYAMQMATAVQNVNGAGYGPPPLLTISAGGCMSHTINPQGASFTGAGLLSTFVSPPGEDTFAAPDAYTTPTHQGAAYLSNFDIILEGGVDASKAWTLVNDSGTTAETANYRPAYVMTPSANYPKAVEWIQGSGANLTGAGNGVATTNGTTLICVTGGTVPTVGQQIMFPYLSGGLQETTVASTAGTCGTGTPRTLSASVATGTQQEYFFGTSIQHTGIDFPASRTYPFTLTLANSISPNAGSPYPLAPYGMFQIGAEQCTYTNANYQTVALTVSACTGTAVDHPVGSFIAPLNPFKPSSPFPVFPTINSGDTTPSNASWFPGHNIGNCAWAFPQSNGSTNEAAAWANAHLENIVITQNNLPNYSNTCGMYFVGMPYATHFNDIRYIGEEYGIVEAMPATENHNFWAGQPTADSSTWTGLTFRNAYPLMIINSDQNHFANIDSYSQLGNSSGGAVGCATGFYTGYGWDDQTGAAIGSMNQTTVDNFYVEPESGTHCGQEILISMEGFSNQFTGWHMGGGGYVRINGADQHWIGGNLNNSSGFGNVAPIMNWGSYTTFDYTENVGGSPFCNVFNYGSVTLNCQFLNWGPGTKLNTRIDNAGPLGNSVYGNNRAVIRGQTAEAFGLGNVGSKNFISSDAGFITPEEISSFDAMTTGWVFDSLAETTQSAATCTNSSGCSASRFNGNGIFIGPGQRITPGKYWMTSSFRSNLATNSFNFSIATLCPSQTFVYGPTSVSTVNTGYTTISALVDFSSYTSTNPYCTLQLVFGAPTSADTISWQYTDFAPLSASFNTQQLNIIGSGSPTITNTNGAETWQTASPTTGCGSTWPNGTVWHNVNGTAAAANRFWVCDSATTTWNAKFQEHR